jgi:transcriptional regulator with XRE-family HTH domain
MNIERKPLDTTNEQAAPAGRSESDDASLFSGAEVRSLRKARNITLTELSKESGLSVGYLSQIERNVSTPSVKALTDLSRALGVTVSWFFNDGHQGPKEEQDFVVRKANRRKLGYGDLGGTDYLLTPNLDGQLELLLTKLQPGGSCGDEPYTHRGEEAGLILSGRLEMWVGDRHFTLDEGDSFNFASTTPHRYRNACDRETVIVWAITPPSY